ncbi:MAG: tRNA pseudouridine(55) synthase TruB [Clostridiales bacterium]|nr:tRNA pseudouridine(55) synthase TruB [Clostridiales bacterium]
MIFDGVILVDKPEGWTSFKTDGAIKKLTGSRKAGHLGTLDPFATGLLPVFCGKGLKYLRFCEGYDKEYSCRAVFGAVTDTGDCTGEVVSENYPSAEEMAELVSTDFAKVREAFAEIANRTEQKPPSYSAKKIGGVKAYDLARKGGEVDLPPAKIKIYSLVIDKIETLEKGFAVTFTCACSKGTYIRTICTDCGELLGYGAHAQTLRRTKNGPFSVENAYTPDQLFEMAEKEDYSFLQSSSTAISHIPEVSLNARQAKDLGFGKKIPFEGVPVTGERTYYRAVFEDNTIAVVYPSVEDGKTVMRIERLFAND